MLACQLSVLQVTFRMQICTSTCWDFSKSAKFSVHECRLWSHLQDGWHYRCCKVDHNLFSLYIPYSHWAVPLFKLTNKNVCLMVVFCKVCWVRNKRGQWMRRGQPERGRCGIAEVRDPETDETRGRENAEEDLERGRRQKHSLVHSLSWLTARREAVARGKGRRKGKKGDQKGVSTSVCEWRLSLEGAVRGHRGGTAGTPPPPSPPSPLAPEIRPGKWLMSDTKINMRPGPHRQPCKMMHAML